MKIVLFSDNKKLIEGINGDYNVSIVSSRDELEKLIDDYGEHTILLLDFDFDRKQAEKINIEYISYENVDRIVISDEFSLFDIKKHQDGIDAADGYISAPNPSIIQGIAEDFQLSRKGMSSKKKKSDKNSLGVNSYSSENNLGELSFVCSDATNDLKFQEKSDEEVNVRGPVDDVELEKSVDSSIVRVDELIEDKKEDGEGDTVVVSDGEEAFEIDLSDLDDALRDGFKRIK